TAGTGTPTGRTVRHLRASTGHSRPAPPAGPTAAVSTGPTRTRCRTTTPTTRTTRTSSATATAGEAKRRRCGGSDPPQDGDHLAHDGGVLAGDRLVGRVAR